MDRAALAYQAVCRGEVGPYRNRARISDYRFLIERLGIFLQMPSSLPSQYLGSYPALAQALDLRTKHRSPYPGLGWQQQICPTDPLLLWLPQRHRYRQPSQLRTGQGMRRRTRGFIQFPNRRSEKGYRSTVGGESRSCTRLHRQPPRKRSTHCKNRGGRARVAIMLPVVVRDAADDVEPEYEMDAGAVVGWREGVEVYGVRTHFYLNVS